MSMGMKKCQAIDSVDDKRVECTAPVKHDSLVQSSLKTPLVCMCDIHLWSLKRHFSCPVCGAFCAQGEFMRCTGSDNRNGVFHLFHKMCFFYGLCCPHCGNKSNIEFIKLDLQSTSIPTLLLQATSPLTYSKQIGAIILKFGSVLDTSGLISKAHQRTLDKLSKEAILLYKNDSIPSYPLKELYSAVIEGKTTKVLFMLMDDAPCDIVFKEHNTSETVLHVAARKGNVVIAHILLQAGGTVDSDDDCLRTSLMVGILHDKIDIVHYLINRKANVNHVNNFGSSCLHIAIKVKNFRMCRVLLGNREIKLDLRDSEGLTPLALACRLGYSTIVKLLLERGRADPKVTDKEENTALYWAAFSGNIEICKACINFGCNVNDVNLHGDTALHIATRRNNSDAVKYLLSMGAYCDTKNKSGQCPPDCCSNVSACRASFKFRALIRTLGKRTFAMERIVSSDISKGAEKKPIQCINSFDETDLIAEDFIYITENVKRCPVKINRRITSLQHCTCTSQCSSLDCKCANLSFGCWYDHEGRLVPEFDYVNPPTLMECNKACFCDMSICKNRVVQKGIKCNLELFRTTNRGWGVRTLKVIPKGSFICEYLGEIISDSDADKKENYTYPFDLHNGEGETYCLDARQFGNTVKLLNSGHSRGTKKCPFLRSVRYWEKAKNT